MAAPDGRKPQVVDPEVIAGLQRILTIRGPMGVLDVLDLVIPTISLGQIEDATVIVRTPAFRPSDIFGGVNVSAPAAGTILADTGALPAGTYDVELLASSNETTQNQAIRFEHRDAANAANLAAFDIAFGSAGGFNQLFPFGYEIGLNERLRAQNLLISSASRLYAVVIFARIR